MTEFHPTMLLAMNDHANREIYATHVYLHASFWFEQRNYDGIASFLKKEAEQQHHYALQLYEYIHLRQGGVGLVTSIPEAVSSWNAPSDVFATLLRLEQDYFKFVTKLRSLASELKDNGTHVFLRNFVFNQERTIRKWLRLNDKIVSYTALPGLIWHLNKELK
jgi:ferritin